MKRRSSAAIMAMAGALAMAMSPSASTASPAAVTAACAATVSATPTAHCFAMYRSTGTTGLHAEVAPTGFGPAELHDAYKLPATGGTGQTIAIVDAFDDPNAEADLAVYRQQYGLPACTTASGCFSKVNQRGATAPLPPGSGNWGVEISLDLDMVSAACPGCKILLVEGDDSSLVALGKSVDTAVTLGATAVSNSYGTNEFNGMDAYVASYNHPGVPILVSSGDSGFRAASFPAVFTSVIAVGGTSLTKDSSARGWSEQAWSGAGSGCSAWIAKPSWQHDPNCGMRTTADISAVASPQTGLAVYDTYSLGSQAGWLVVGGTSASSPFIAGVIGLAGNGRQISDASGIYAHAANLFDAVGGSNGYCGGDYLCTGVPGYDGPTGMGTPNGVSAF